VFWTSNQSPLTDRVAQNIFRSDPEYQRLAQTEPPHVITPADYLFGTDADTTDPQTIFSKLRWGGQFVFASRNRRATTKLSENFAERGFNITHGPAALKTRFPIPFLRRKTHYFVARKNLLIQPRELSDRFTYHVQLVDSDRPGQPCTVLKEIPAPERVAARLRKRFPELSDDIIEKRSRKFTEKIFPLFLTREAAMLQILERDLPAKYAGRVPKLLDKETDSRGFVRKLRMNWLRTGGAQLPQVEFARQCAELLHVLHDTVGVIHLDLRLDNIVITEGGVGFVDFGSSVRIGENLAQNPLLDTLFEELMRTSEIQRMLERMTLSGKVTSPVIRNGYQKVDKSVDFFYLAVQINNPLKNPDFDGLVAYDPESRQAIALKQMTDEVLRPRDLLNPKFKSAADMLRAIQTIAES
jgi:hypothetical protein